jgi:anion-transporting  ArsA/GET3 family ATPase
MEALWERRAVLISGKGGVGKTTFAAALARAAVASGRRVLLADMEVSSEETGSSPLASLVGVREPGSRVTEVEPGRLAFVRLSAAEGHRSFLEQVLPIRLMADAAMRSRALRRFLEAGPALREMGVLYHLLDLLQRTRKDKSFEHPLCIVDLPATGHALALASLPQVLLSVLPGGPIGRNVRTGMDFLQDPARCAALLVTLPEPLPVSETLELATELSRHRIPLAGVVLNRVPEDPFPPEGRAALERLLDTHGPHLGHRALGRLDRARAAEARLATHLVAPLLRVPELPFTGRELVARLAEVLSPSTRAPARTSGVFS